MATLEDDSSESCRDAVDWGGEEMRSVCFSEALFYCRLIASHSNFPICLQFRENGSVNRFSG